MQLRNKLAKFYGCKASCTEELEELEPLFSIAQVFSSIKELNLNSYFYWKFCKTNWKYRSEVKTWSSGREEKEELEH